MGNRVDPKVWGAWVENLALGPQGASVHTELEMACMGLYVKFYVHALSEAFRPVAAHGQGLNDYKILMLLMKLVDFLA